MINFIIAEYNPFHYGHQYQLNKIKGSKIIILSGDITQRGEAAIQGKYIRAQWAIKNGADLVLELPIMYTLQSATNYAKGGVKLAADTNLNGTLVFSAENPEELPKFYQELNSRELIPIYHQFRKEGYAHGHALRKAYKCIHSRDVLFKSNNILGLSYLEALKDYPSLKYQILQRIGDDYRNKQVEDAIASATAIRRFIAEDKKESIENFLPKNVYLDLPKKWKTKSFYPLLQYRLGILQDSMVPITGYERGMEDLFRKNIENTEEDFFNKTISKRYTKVRIRRLILNYLLDITKKELDQSLLDTSYYFKVLASNHHGLDLLKEIKSHSSVPIITNYRQFRELKGRMRKSFIKDLSASFLVHGKIEDYYGAKMQL